MIYERILRYSNIRKNFLLEALIAKQNKYNILYDHGIYFRSIKGTLNHILFADYLWYMRIANLKKLNLSKNNFVVNYGDISKYWTIEYTEMIFEAHFKNEDYLISQKLRQNEIDKLIYDFLINKPLEDFNKNISYLDTQGNEQTKILSDCVFHLVNHSTHHIGQITGVLSKEDFPSLDYTSIIH